MRRCCPHHTASMSAGLRRGAGVVRARNSDSLPSPPRPTILPLTSRHTHHREADPMPADKKIRVAIIGLGFGAEFIPIYQAHPNAEMYAVCRRNLAEMDKVGDRYGIKARYTDYNDLLKD